MPAPFVPVHTKCIGLSITRHMRAHLLAALVALVSAAAVLTAITFELSSRDHLERLERAQAVEEAHALFGVLNGKITALTNEVINIGRSLGIIESLFPPHVYRSLKQGTLPSESFEVASVMFSDVIDFKAWATATPPEAVAQFLNGFIDGLDEIADRHGVTKIKTILDLYLATSGIPVATKTHAADILRMALEFHKFCGGKAIDSAHRVQLRIGVSSGPVAGGIIGKRNWVYDIWSDTVNMAARLKAKSQSGAVLCDDRTHELACSEFEFDEPVVLELKGKGAQKAFFLRGPSSQ
eukprot:m51a1_g5056 putative adenylate guanylate cyclase (295) ;mRNA; f:97566-102244